MAKQCANCGCKVGFISGEHFDGLLCDNCYNSMGGMLLITLETENNFEKYVECYEKIIEKIDMNANIGVDREKIKYEFDKLIDSKCKIATGYGIRECFQKKS
jgi:hypothetical protein